jgi:hypothetical protein
MIQMKKKKSMTLEKPEAIKNNIPLRRIDLSSPSKKWLKSHRISHQISFDDDWGGAARLLADMSAGVYTEVSTARGMVA